MQMNEKGDAEKKRLVGSCKGEDLGGFFPISRRDKVLKGKIGRQQCKGVFFILIIICTSYSKI